MQAEYRTGAVSGRPGDINATISTRTDLEFYDDYYRRPLIITYCGSGWPIHCLGKIGQRSVRHGIVITTRPLSSDIIKIETRVDDGVTRYSTSTCHSEIVLCGKENCVFFFVIDVNSAFPDQSRVTLQTNSSTGSIMNIGCFNISDAIEKKVILCVKKRKIEKKG